MIVCDNYNILVAACGEGELEEINPNPIKRFFYWDRV